ncbi:MAG: DUF4910 domain-containing protein [Thermosediminibacteraceae bacterium]|nr:DUF4910 domain-containing protein [Thermosediminibacteraceae bacterium]
MFYQIYKSVAGEISEERCFDILNGIIRFHRLQLSPGIEEAARYCAEVLKQRGLDGRVNLYRPDPSKGFFGYRPSPGWECRRAKLWVWEEEKKRYVKLADFEENAFSVIQRSCPTLPDGIEAKLVEIKDPENEKSFASKDVKGKFVLARGNMSIISYYAIKYGAIGVITDEITESWPVRTRWDLPDARQYTAFPSYACGKLLGFVLTPRQGEELRRSLARGEVRLKALVDSSFYEPQVPVVSALIPGETHEEIIIIAHICHPKPSANDNASGAAAAIEAVSTLNELVREGLLARPRLGIRLLLVPEMGGTFAYLSSEPEKPKALAGINLDMVGENQAVCGSTLKVEYPPLAARSFVGTLLKEIMSYCAKDAGMTGEQKGYSVLRWGAYPYSGGSDHYILSDPAIGIPTPMINQWPDKYYHTDHDTPDKVDKSMLKRAAVVAATYAYFLATMGEAEALWLVDIAAGEAQKALTEYSLEIIRSAACGSEYVEDMKAGLEFLTEIKKGEIRSITNFADTPKVRKAVGETDKALDEIFRILRSQIEKPQEVYGKVSFADNKRKVSEEYRQWVEEAKTLIPRRIYPGPVELIQYVDQMDSETAESLFELLRRFGRSGGEYLFYYADGKSSLYEISRKVLWETGKDYLEFLLKYAKISEKLKLIELMPNI